RSGLLVSVIAVAAVVTVIAFGGIGAFNAITTLFAALAAVFFSFQHLRLLGDGLIATDNQVTDHGIVVAEVVFQLGQGLAAALDVQHHVVSLVNIVDGVGQLTTAPVFQAVNLAAVFFDQLGVTLNHAADLLALVRVNQKDDFVMTHEMLLTG